MKIAVIGANGQLGSDICAVVDQSSYELLPLNEDVIDIRQKDSVTAALTGPRPDVVVNTAAMHHVERCEDEPVRAFEVNGVGARNLAQVCNAIDALLVHISTDYVFDGKKRAPYIETDRPAPLNVYANTKLSGEHFIEAIARRYHILRVCGIYGKNPCLAKGYNFVQLMLKLAHERKEIRVVDDEILTPTSTVEISRQILHMLKQGAESGLYHCTAEGSCSWYEFAVEIFATAKCDVVLNRAAPGEFAGKVNRPPYSVLENANLKRQGLNVMAPWREGLRRHLAPDLSSGPGPG